MLSNRIRPPLLFGLVMLGLYLSSIYSFLLFHSLAEIFSVIIGFSIFILVWNSQNHLDNKYLLFLGITYPFVSGLDLFHTLAYKGMAVFPGFDSDLATQLWIAARYLQSISFLIAPIFLRRKLNISLVMLSYLAVTALLLAMIFTGFFPDCFVEGEGLTPFKIISEYIIAFLLLASIILLYKNRKVFDPDVSRWLTTSLFLTIGSELAFTFYISVYSISNLVGHLLKIIAFYYVYKAIVNMGIEMPHRLLFRNLKQSESALEKALAQTQQLAITDSLTGLYNRRHFFELFERELERARRYQSDLSAIILDIDRFKHINDTCGHAVGDQVLQDIARCCRQTVRKVDVLARYGGDEFVVMLPETDLAAARQVAEHLCQNIAQMRIETETDNTLRVTASIGVTTLSDGASTPEKLLNDADQFLYKAKWNGRNRVCST